MVANKITDKLTNVRLRQQFQRGFAYAAMGLFAGGLLGSMMLLLQRAAVIETETVAWLAVVVGSLVGLALGL